MRNFFLLHGEPTAMRRPALLDNRDAEADIISTFLPPSILCSRCSYAEKCTTHVAGWEKLKSHLSICISSGSLHDPRPHVHKCNSLLKGKVHFRLQANCIFRVL